jgi:threonylcarbamoyladenosine tRNA methylthiotransferase MtaB
MPNKVPSRLSTERVSRLEELSRRLHKSFAERYLDTEREVLFESTDHDGLMYGYTDNYIRVAAPYDATKINTICNVKLVSADDDALVTAEIVE